MFTRYVLPAVAIIGAIFAVFVVAKGNQKTPATLPVADPAMAPFPAYVAGAGLVEASTENIPLGTPVPGIVTKLNHWTNDRVKAGDVLFQIDSRDLDAELKVRQAALVSAKSNVEAASAMNADAKAQYDNVQAMENDHYRAMSREEMDKRKYAAANTAAKLAQAKADVNSAEAQIEQTQTELERRLIRAPVDGTVMQCKVHLGEYAPAGPVNPPLMMLGNIDVLNVRVDIDENDAWRVDTTRPAVAFLRGNRDLSANLKFFRIEPYVIPKQSLTGDSTERVDTRVLQVLYSFDPKQLAVHVGQQMDVFIDAQPIGK